MVSWQSELVSQLVPQPVKQDDSTETKKKVRDLLDAY